MELDTVLKHRQAWYRLVGTESGDQSLEEQDEATEEVAYLALTRGCRAAQRHMIRNGYGGWRKRSSALTFTGTDSADGGRKVALPSDCLRIYGNRRRSALVEANGDRWGREIDEEEDHLRGNYYYVRGEELWLGRTATPPSTMFLDFHYIHPEWNSSLADGDIDFPMEARPLIVATAATVAKDDNWLPGGIELEAKIDRALLRAQEEARDISRRSKQPRTFRKPVRIGNRW